METILPNLEELGQQLRTVDRHLINLLARRMDIARKVEEYKRVTNQLILRQDIEDARLFQYKEWAHESGLNPNFISAIMYQVIAESCRVQFDQHQRQTPLPIAPVSDEEYSALLKRNLLRLTEKWAPRYDQDYATAYPATKMYFRFEGRLIEQEISRLIDKNIALDLGCATGRRTRKLSKSFSQVFGYDISPAMISEASEIIKQRDADRRGTVSFAAIDLEYGIPRDKNEASFVVMSLGTGSDIKNIADVLKEVKRVLVPGGRFLMSFYNADALIYRWRFLPWPTPLAAEINLTKHCLDVHYLGEIYSVYARPYAMPEVHELLSESGLALSRVLTYPTISSILPQGILENADITGSVNEIEENLSSLSGGAYILVAGNKQ